MDILYKIFSPLMITVNCYEIQHVFDTELLATIRINQTKLLEKSLLKSITFEFELIGFKLVGCY